MVWTISNRRMLTSLHRLRLTVLRECFRKEPASPISLLRRIEMLDDRTVPALLAADCYLPLPETDPVEAVACEMEVLEQSSVDNIAGVELTCSIAVIDDGSVDLMLGPIEPKFTMLDEVVDDTIIDPATLMVPVVLDDGSLLPGETIAGEPTLASTGEMGDFQITMLPVDESLADWPTEPDVDNLLPMVCYMVDLPPDLEQPGEIPDAVTMEITWLEGVEEPKMADQQDMEPMPPTDDVTIEFFNNMGTAEIELLTDELAVAFLPMTQDLQQTYDNTGNTDESAPITITLTDELASADTEIEPLLETPIIWPESELPSLLANDTVADPSTIELPTEVSATSILNGEAEMTPSFSYVLINDSTRQTACDQS